MSYADLTTGDRNPVKRWLQRRRFSDAMRGVLEARAGDVVQILDLGAGDGELARRAASLPSVSVTVYEPMPSQMAEARARLAGCSSVSFVESLDSLPPGAFDYVFCLEVFEHLPPRETSAAIGDIHRLLKPEGTAVVGVPHELHLP